MIFKLRKMRRLDIHLTVLLVAMFLSACTQPGSETVVAPPVENPPTSTAANPTEDQLPATQQQDSPTGGETIQLRDNLARGAAVSASSAMADKPPELAVDGKDGYQYAWSSSAPGMQWIEIDLGAPVDIQRVELIISQTRNTETAHQVWGRGPDQEDHLLYEIRGMTANGQAIIYTPEEPWTGVQILRIETHQTPLHAGWQEVQVFGQPAAVADEDAGEANLIFHNGNIITMEDGHPLAQAIALNGKVILEVGAEDEVLSLAGPDTVVIDLDGRTMIPGFVDAHSHVFNDPGSVGEDLYSVQELALRNGVTSIANMYTTQDLVEQMLAIDAAGDLRLRLSLYLNYNDACGDPLPNHWYLDFPQNIDPDARLHITGIKVFSDGGSCNAPAVSFEYPNDVGMGDLYYTQEEMDEIVRSIQGNGYQAAIHALGDRALDQVLRSIQRANDGGPNEFRHRIEHNALVRDDQILLYSQAQPVALVFGAFQTCIYLGGSSKFRYAVPAANQTWEWRWRDMIEANPDVIFAWHGDTPVFEFNPIRNLWGFVTRLDFAADGSLCQPPDWAASQTLPVETALRLMTINAAYAIHRDGQVGSLKAGKLADLVILSEDPLTVDPASIIDIQVLATFLDGQTAFCQPGFDHLCP